MVENVSNRISLVARAIVRRSTWLELSGTVQRSLRVAGALDGCKFAI